MIRRVRLNLPFDVIAQKSKPPYYCAIPRLDTGDSFSISLIAKKTSPFGYHIVGNNSDAWADGGK